MSSGRLDRLREAITLAQVDWRDLLVAAEFAKEVDAQLGRPLTEAGFSPLLDSTCFAGLP